MARFFCLAPSSVSMASIKKMYLGKVSELGDFGSNPQSSSLWVTQITIIKKTFSIFYVDLRELGDYVQTQKK
jgi:hypothetical protein